eukprot:CAMPEP_0181412922 /NCGR_PEP_ID=MMETSP1110-20121109/8685_1 /TAXON_ID=174948 /ORGANISM="Symbiodinium sp., Strain CCMP421" /LENGTH=564 /DNA_ID=CAMNT_0023535677 /DNA_START=236 /DNA_END=1926 /DNA_ORIENTATION=-
MAGKDCVKLENLSSGFFDFDELDKAENELPSEPTTNEGHEEDGLDSLSELWPGDMPADQELEDDEDDLPDLVPGDCPVDSSPAWEVCVLRLLVRKLPSLEAPVQGICHEHELLFEEPGCAEADWLCLENRSGFVLKDGSCKDPKLGQLVRPFRLVGVPTDLWLRVAQLLREAWRQLRTCRPGVQLLRPATVTKLRRAAEDAVSVASRNGFDFDIFQEEFRKGAAAVNSDQGFLAQARALLQKTEMTAAQAGVRQRYLPRMGVFQDSVQQWMEAMQQRILPAKEDAAEVLMRAAELQQQQPTLVKLQVPVGATLHVVGDLHGQFWDLLHILQICGDPSPQNQYLFNGDFVDRGQYSVEVALLLLSLKVAHPMAVHLNRGNHEAARMNALYGFMQETEQKYNIEIFRLFTEAFKNLPLATVVNDSVFVVHGGLSSKDGVLLRDIAALDRRREPDEAAEQLMLDLLWSDPMDSPGRQPSPRGGGVLFGPDVTESFCVDNSLCCIIRSHEMKSEGFEWQHLKRCLTIFSAPNYCDVCGNLGAVCDITPTKGRRVTVEQLAVRTFECSP